MITTVKPDSKLPAAAAPSALNFLGPERELLERFLPGFDAALAQLPLSVLESRDNPSIKLLKDYRGPALLIPAEYGGLGASAAEGLQVLRAIASRAPSLGIAYTMHNFSVATLVAWAVFGEEYGRFILSSLAEHSMYLASGFAEGRSGAKALDLTMKARRSADGGWLITGRKKPCSLTHSMDFLTCGLVAEVEEGVWRRGVGLVPADLPGIERRPFWKSNVLAGAESDEVELINVEVPEQFVFVVEDATALDPVEVTGYTWFQLALCATYLGIASGLVERLLQSGKGTPEERGFIVAQVEAHAAAIEGLAYALDGGTDRERLFARSLATRCAVQSTIESVVMKAAELLGGIAFMGSPDVAYLLCASRAMCFHPPGRIPATRALDEYARGGPLDLT
jgi:alkylation response protein AidB-like acyl-CoA dehydrogenase